MEDGQDMQPTSMRILLVDDDIALRGITAAHLRKAGYMVDIACNGREGLKLAVDNHPDIVIADIMMPVMDGNELLKAIRTRESTRDIYVIFLTAKDRTADVLEGFAASADDYITKPFSMAELTARVTAGARLIEIRKRQQETNRKLETAIQQRARLLGVAVHDIRNPINIVTTYISLLGQDIISAEEIKEVCLRRMTDLVQLIDNLLDITKIDAGLVEIEVEELDAALLLKEVTALLKPVAIHKQITLHSNAPETLKAHGDPRRLQEAMSTLLHTVIRLSAENTAIELEMKAEERQLAFTIKGDCTGICAPITDEIFEPPSDSGSIPKGYNTSELLGLAIVKKVASIMGGEVFAGNEGTGIVFGFRLPLEIKSQVAEKGGAADR